MCLYKNKSLLALQPTFWLAALLCWRCAESPVVSWIFGNNFYIKSLFLGAVSVLRRAAVFATFWTVYSAHPRTSCSSSHLKTGRHTTQNFETPTVLLWTNTFFIHGCILKFTTCIQLLLTHKVRTLTFKYCFYCCVDSFIWHNPHKVLILW